MSSIEVTDAELLVIRAMRQHVTHGYGEITISIRPDSVRVQEGKGHVFETGKNGKG